MRGKRGIWGIGGRRLGLLLHSVDRLEAEPVPFQEEDCLFTHWTRAAGTPKRVDGLKPRPLSSYSKPAIKRWECATLAGLSVGRGWRSRRLERGETELSALGGNVLYVTLLLEDTQDVPIVHTANGHRRRDNGFIYSGSNLSPSLFFVTMCSCFITTMIDLTENVLFNARQTVSNLIHLASFIFLSFFLSRDYYVSNRPI